MISPLKYFVQKVLPAVYDDALSYYEVLGKVTEKLNEVINSVNNMADALAGILNVVDSETGELREYIDGQDEILDNKIDAKMDKDNPQVTGDLNVSGNAHVGGNGTFDGALYSNGDKEIPTKEYVDGRIDNLYSTKANKNNPTFTGIVTCRGGAFLYDNKPVATQEYVNNAVSGATGVSIGSGTFTPESAIASDFSGYVTTRQYGNIVFINAYCALNNGVTFADLTSGGTLGKITGVDIPYPALGMMQCITTDGTNFHSDSIAGYLGVGAETALTVSKFTIGDNVLILNGFYFTS